MATIWTVEDEETISVLLVKIIKSMGHESVHCYDSAELEHQLKKGLPDLMLLDLTLRGAAAIRFWRTGRRTRAPVIFRSSSCPPAQRTLTRSRA